LTIRGKRSFPRHPKNLTFGALDCVVRSLPVAVVNLDTATGKETPPRMLSVDLTR